VFPYFIATTLPTGVAGGLLAAILAATMSSMTSGINALSASLTMDFRERLGTSLSPQQELRFAKITSLVVGLAATAVAGFVNRMGDIFQISQGLLGVFLGPLLCCILLSLTRRRIPSIAMAVSLILGCIAGWAVILTDVHNLWAATAAFGVSFLVALAGGLLGKMTGAKSTADLVHEG
jgi:Na+/proline symporter